MKKGVLRLLLLLIIALAGIYIFIPGKITISTLHTGHANIRSVYRYIGQEDLWNKWWRNANGQPQIMGQPYIFNASQFQLTKPAYNMAGVEVERKDTKVAFIVNLVSLAKDSTGIIWTAEMPSGLNPISRIRNYLNATDIKKDIDGVMQVFTSFIAEPKNIYGMSISQYSIQDTLYMASLFNTKTYPTTSDLYGYFDILNKVVLKQHATVVGPPIMNLRKLEDGTFETQFALPTNRKLEDEGQIRSKRMPPGQFLTAEVKGGPYTVEEAVKQLDLYLREYNREQVATSFRVLVTDRRTEPDTTKWITLIRIPVVP